METVAKIRHRHHVKGDNISKISRELNIARNTVKKVLKSADPGKRYSRQKISCPQLSNYVEELKRLLEADAQLLAKRRHTARRLYETLKVQGYCGAYDSIQRYVKTWRETVGGKLQTKAYIPLCFRPGEAYQFDWSQEIAEIAGATQTIHLAHIRLSFSRMFLVIAYPRETQEMLFDAHNSAFAFFGGDPTRGIYDNLKTGIDTI